MSITQLETRTFPAQAAKDNLAYTRGQLPAQTMPFESLVKQNFIEVDQHHIATGTRV
jgi:hypothetical protein